MSFPGNNSDEEHSSDSSDLELEFRFLHAVVTSGYLNRRRIPRNTSILRGGDWVGELLTGTDERFFDAVRMTKPCFTALVETLTTRGLLTLNKQSRVSPEESMVIFMRTVAMHTRFRDHEERFQHSKETIWRHLHRVSKALNHLAKEFIPPPNFNEIPNRILDNPQFYPYFQVFRPQSLD